MKIAEINKKTGEVVHIFDAVKVPIFADNAPVYCEEVDETVKEGDKKNGDKFDKKAAQVDPAIDITGKTDRELVIILMQKMGMQITGE